MRKTQINNTMLRRKIVKYIQNRDKFNTCLHFIKFTHRII